MSHLARDRFRRCDFLETGTRISDSRVGWVFPPEVEELVASLKRRIEALEAENAELR